MSDVVDGIAVVQPLEYGLYRVCLRLSYSDGHKEPCSLVFHDAKMPANLKAAMDKIGETVWCFRKDVPRHGWLDCQPSIRQMLDHKTERFHNTFNWQVQYVWLRYTACNAGYNIWKILNQYGDDENGKPMPPVTAEIFQKLRSDGYIC